MNSLNDHFKKKIWGSSVITFLVFLDKCTRNFTKYFTNRIPWIMMGKKMTTELLIAKFVLRIIRKCQDALEQKAAVS